MDWLFLLFKLFLGGFAAGFIYEVIKGSVHNIINYFLGTPEKEHENSIETLSVLMFSNVTLGLLLLSCVGTIIYLNKLKLRKNIDMIFILTYLILVVGIPYINVILMIIRFITIIFR